MIDRENVIKWLESQLDDLQKYADADEVVTLTQCQAKDIVALLKRQEAVDNNTGEWKNGHCSCCGEDIASMLDTWTNVQNFLFCPNCGAKMEE